MKLIEVLDGLKKASPIPSNSISESVVQNLARIKEICDSKYFNQSFYGNAALNRQILLDKEIADLLSPEVIRYLFTQEPTENEKIFRNSTGKINLRDAIYFGFADGLSVVRLMPNNESQYTPATYEEQKEKYKSNTLRIIQNIKTAANIAEIEDDPENMSLVEQFAEAVSIINSIKILNQSDKLLSVPGYTPEEMRIQVNWGFGFLCYKLGVSLDSKGNIENQTLDSLCENFLQNSDVILDGKVIHLFYDRAHIEAALEQDTIIPIGDEKYTYKDIFSKMVEKISVDGVNYPECAKEQFYLRFGLVKTDLNNRFSKSDLEALVLDKQLIDAASKKEWEEVLNILNSDNKPTTKAMQYAKDEAFSDIRWDIVSMIEKAKNKEEYLLTAGPLPKSKYTYQLEVITRELMQNQKFNLEKVNNEELISFGNDIKYNLTKIMQHANFDHLTFNNYDFKLYDKYHDDFSSKKSTLNANEIAKLSPQFKSLSAAEMKAINIYTGKYYAEINKFLRKKGNYCDYSEDQLRNLIIHSAMCGSALSKVPDQNIDTTYRGESIFDNNIHLERIEAASQKGVVRLSGFVSSSLANLNVCNVVFTFTNIRGKYIAPLSKHVDEQEYLIAPTYIKITDYEYNPDSQCSFFQASQVVDLSIINKELIQNDVEMLEKYLTEEIERLPQSRSCLLDSEKTELKSNMLIKCKKNLDILIDEMNTNKLSETESVDRFNAILQEIESIAQIQRTHITIFKDDTTTSQLLFKAVKDDLEFLSTPGNVIKKSEL